MGQDRRLELDAELREILGSTNVYFQPPENIKMLYPAIVYNRARGWSNSADNYGYRFTQGYSVTYISNDPDNEIIEKLTFREKSTYDRSFIADALSHDVFTLYH